MFILWHDQAMGEGVCVKCFHAFEGDMKIIYAFEGGGACKFLPSRNISTRPLL